MELKVCSFISFSIFLSSIISCVSGKKLLGSLTSCKTKSTARQQVFFSKTFLAVTDLLLFVNDLTSSVEYIVNVLLFCQYFIFILVLQKQGKNEEESHSSQERRTTRRQKRREYTSYVDTRHA